MQRMAGRAVLPLLRLQYLYRLSVVRAEMLEMEQPSMGQVQVLQQALHLMVVPGQVPQVEMEVEVEAVLAVLEVVRMRPAQMEVQAVQEAVQQVVVVLPPVGTAMPEQV